MACGIYEIWCGPYFYQGSSKNIDLRWKQHRRQLLLGKHRNPKFQRAFDKHGWADASVLVECEEHTLLAWEQAYIDTNWGDERYLNLSEAAGRPASQKGKKRGPHSDETRAKIGAGNKGKKAPPRSPEWRAAHSSKMTGRKHTDEARAKMSVAQKGVPKSPEHRAKIIALNTGRVPTAEARVNMSDAGKGKPKSDEHRSNIGAALRGKPKSDESRAKLRAYHARRRAEKAEHNKGPTLFVTEN